MRREVITFESLKASFGTWQILHNICWIFLGVSWIPMSSFLAQTWTISTNVVAAKIWRKKEKKSAKCILPVKSGRERIEDFSWLALHYSLLVLQRWLEKPLERTTASAFSPEEESYCIFELKKKKGKLHIEETSFHCSLSLSGVAPLSRCRVSVRVGGQFLQFAPSLVLFDSPICPICPHNCFAVILIYPKGTSTDLFLFNLLQHLKFFYLNLL